VTNWVKVHQIEVGLRYHRARYRYRNAQLQRHKKLGKKWHSRRWQPGIERERVFISKWKKLALEEARVCARLEVELIAVRPKCKYRFVGPCSTFGPPGERAESTAYGLSSADAGIAINPDGNSHWNDRLPRSFAMKTARVTIGKHMAYLKVIDKGPSAWGIHGWRICDITGHGAQVMGIDPNNFPTDVPVIVEFF
jgi:hypothetical protein